MLIRMNPLAKIGKFVKDSKRVLKVATKPTKEEYVRTLKITSIGVGLLGGMAFLVFMVFELVRRFVLGI